MACEGAQTAGGGVRGFTRRDGCLCSSLAHCVVLATVAILWHHSKMYYPTEQAMATHVLVAF